MLESLECGQSFVARIDGTAAELDVLQQGPLRQSLRLGRSRSAEFGKVAIEVVKRSRRSVTLPDASASTVQLLLLSDCQLVDEQGQPTIAATGDHFGLPGWQLSPAQTFIETRRYTPYNAYRHSADSERHVLRMGSVLTFERGNAAQASVPFENALLGGVGQHRQEGLGQFEWLQGAWAAESPAQLSAGESPSTAQPPAPPAPSDDLVGWLNIQSDMLKHSRQHMESAETLFKDLSGVRISASQWGSLRTLAQSYLRGAYRGKSLVALVEEQVLSGVRSLNHQWGQKVHGNQTAAQILLNGLNKIQENKENTQRAGTLYQLAHRQYLAARRPQEGA
jgi:hypothetical protein